MNICFKSIMSWLEGPAFLMLELVCRLCQDIAHLKSEVAELLLPYVVVNLAMKNDEDESFCRLVSLQVKFGI